VAKYSSTSPWYRTTITNNYLDIMTVRPVSAEMDDKKFTIVGQYHLRPDLLAYDIYDTPKLWWVFAQRNMNVIDDPIFDFTTGTVIYLPEKSRLFKMLGI
jgi:hypothetical protein